VPDEAKDRAKKAAGEFEDIRVQVTVNEMDTGRLLAQIDHLAHDLREYAAEWEGVDPHRADRIREQLSQLLAYRKDVEEDAEYNIAEIEELRQTISSNLRIARGEQTG
jgi:hypothetical protein